MICFTFWVVQDVERVKNGLRLYQDIYEKFAILSRHNSETMQSLEKMKEVKKLR